METNTDHWINILFDTKIYSLRSIKNACYDFSGECFFKLDIAEENGANVKLKTKDPNIKFDLNCFLNCVLDHQVRIDTENEFKTIREMIVAQAFQPCENLEEIVSLLVNDEE
jgi:His-Xaa-Ser system protein HxsD